MNQNYSGRVTIILLVLFGALYCIFPRGNLTKPNLKPGIDMAGGTSLLYEIKEPPGGYQGTKGTLAEEVMEALKKRVDPSGTKNLVWRPQGNNRLEIQMPMTAASGNNKEIRDAYSNAQDALKKTNVTTGEVVSAVESLKGDARRDKLNQLAQGSKERATLYGLLASTYDQIQQAKAEHNAALQAEKENAYDDLKAKFAETNLTSNQLQDILDAGGQVRSAKLAELRKKYEDFPARLAAIDEFVKTYDEYSKIKNSIDDAGQLKRLLQGSGVLEFHILVTDPNAPGAQDMVKRLHEKGPAVEANDTMRWYQVDKPDEFRGGRMTQVWNDKTWVLAWITPGKQMVNGPGINPWALEKAYPGNDQLGRQIVDFEFDPQGAKYFSKLTRENINEPLAIVLDDKVVSAPNIHSEIGARGQIDGGEKGYSPEELDYLVSTLSAGSLPAQLASEPISERTVGPQLGADNLRRGLLACALGVVVVVVFLVSYYYLAGIVASIAVVMNLVMILGVMAAFDATFTLPGIAGIVLTIGAAVDANVLIFERLREEQHRGLSLRMALRNAYDRAFSAIIDSNATTFITALILWWLGSEEVKGFGVTLMIGLVSSLFTALFVTKTIFIILIDRFGLDHLGSLPLTFPKWDALLKPNIDWMGMIWYFVGFSAIFLAVGCAAFVWKSYKGEMMDIEFASGTAVQFELKRPLHIDKVREIISSPKYETAIPSPSVVAVGKEDKEYEIVTANADSARVKDAVLEAFGDNLNLEQPSTFGHVRDPVSEALAAKAILPIENASFSVNGYTPSTVASHIGGAAIVLENINPPLTPKQIHDRIIRQRLQPTAGDSSTQQAREFDVESPAGESTPTNFAVILVSDPTLPYEKDQGKWRDSLVTPMWKLVNDAIDKPAQLQSVKNFDPSVAGDTQRAALMALTLSIVVIMAYIWLRFGDLRYGTATVVAMLHDTFLVIGAVGLSHLVGNTAVGHALLIEPFRINLTIVAAILTVMSYSMIDTIVVFDRIRELRGKFGHVSRQIINDAVNQTLSRTLLTGGTNVVTVFIMYLFGGPGIHGFTFVLLIGILVGTYSSIAIAAPILLTGKHEPARQPGRAAAQPKATAKPARAGV